MMETNEWDKALLIAPAVSINYWRKLAKMRAQKGIESGLAVEELYPLFIAGGDVKQLSNMLQDARKDNEAFNLISMQLNQKYTKDSSRNNTNEGTFKQPLLKPILNSETTNALNKTQFCESVDFQELIQLRYRQAAKYIKQGRPVDAACCMLSVDKIQEAIEYLFQGNELELAWIVATMTSSVITRFQRWLVANRFEAGGEWQLAGEVLHEDEVACVLLAVRSQGAFNYKKVQEISCSDNIREILNCLENRDFPKSLELCIIEIEKMLDSEDWISGNKSSILEIQKCLHSIETQGLNKSQLDLLLCYSAYLGAFQAQEQGYTEVCDFLIEKVKRSIRDTRTPFVLSLERIQFDQAFLNSKFHLQRANVQISDLLQSKTLSDSLKQKCLDLQEEIIQKQINGRMSEGKNVIPMWSCYPSGAPKLRRSCVSQKEILGNQYYYVDGQSFLMGEAIMVTRVHPFTQDGKRIIL
eukprot:TRINITY_DN27859_c0_g1_i1.p1 TRINITY_DN27859_c0_g1~~TRINITY_DN27859_c0_g1_i1.p1  ORF type:complete len:469 (+),score=52.35 TRINITY_DN27859_c0_g1_i1:272-1678(+)